MAWSDIRDAIKVVLESVSITSPIAETIKKVYETPPGTVQDLPCFIIYPPAVEVIRGAGARRNLYVVRCRLLVKDADLDVAADLVDAYREEMIAAFDGDVLLAAAPLAGQSCEEATRWEYGGKVYTGFDTILEVTAAASVTLTA